MGKLFVWKSYAKETKVEVWEKGPFSKLYKNQADLNLDKHVWFFCIREDMTTLRKMDYHGIRSKNSPLLNFELEYLKDYLSNEP